MLAGKEQEWKVVVVVHWGGFYTAPATYTLGFFVWSCVCCFGELDSSNDNSKVAP